MRLSEEIFYSIQGEGVYAGLPMVFVRLQGCNLLVPCAWCDTSYARDPTKGFDLSIEDATRRVSELSPYLYSWVCVTGGEPLYQEDELFQLVKSLKKGMYRIEIETNGTLTKPPWWTIVNSWVADIKTPSAGGVTSWSDDWFDTRPSDQVKFVVDTPRDLEFTSKEIQKHRARPPVVLVSPVVEGDILSISASQREWLNEVAEFCKFYRVRMSLQIHKVIWGTKIGV